MALETPIELLKTAFVSYSHVDFDTAKQFYLDFGLNIVEESPDSLFFRGYGTEPFIYHLKRSKTGKSTFDGAAYIVTSRRELERATSVEGATPISRLNAPGGGEVVTLTDPQGFHIHLVHGQAEREADNLDLEKLTFNYEDNKPRKGRFQRFSAGAAPVYRWGHYGVTYDPVNVGYQRMFSWYTEVIGLAPSDFVERDGHTITCFFHVDRKKDFSDHHCFFFKPCKPGQEPNVAHAAFEVHDFDIQQLGHNFLASKNYKLCWGVGRVGGHFIKRNQYLMTDNRSMYWAVKSLTTGSTLVALWSNIMRTVTWSIKTPM
ncbi:hypothetical protein H2198_006489 [Neophaeococcomyces mojaviensis]|uniref:Uncharacterized protein n=1 Tax=Neophaeococcomyces mojaviensis TaxID=3383035 RepID=A0ACC3A2T5_9EURO|nr:hypothetical protein H2198_006489 [Knufia sp. JES_112]